MKDEEVDYKRGSLPHPSVCTQGPLGRTEEWPNWKSGCHQSFLMR